MKIVALTAVLAFQAGPEAGGAVAGPKSLLVAPLELGAKPPETVAVAAVRVSGPGAEVEAGQLEQLARSQVRDFEALARLRAGKPTEQASGLFGVVWPSLIADEVEGALLGLEVGGVATVRIDGAAASWLVIRRIERDAACRQVFVSGTDAGARAKAEAIARELRSGADFAAVARERSDDKASALRGGDLAIYERSANDSLLREAVFQAPPGGVAGPVESPFGFHVLQRTEVGALDPRLRDDSWARARAILIAFTGARGADPGLEREHDEAERIANELAARIRRGEDMAALAGEHRDDRGAPGGGDLGWVRRGTTRMPPFFDKLFTEPPGELIGPIATNAGFVLLRREDPGPRSRLVLRIEPFVDLEQWVRKLAESEAPPPDVAGLGEAVDAARALGAELGSPLMWGVVEGSITLCATAADFEARCAELPERRALPDGREIALRDPATKYAKALARCEAAFLEKVWPGHRTTIDAAAAKLREQLVPLGDAALDEVMEDLAMEDPRVVVPVYLVAEGPRPGAVTHRAPGGAACFVDADETAGTLLLEVVIHEATHALDVATQGRPTALNELRKRLDPRSRHARDVPHTLMFVESAAAVRRVFDPAHRDYGEVEGYYAKVQEAVAAVRGPWNERLASGTPVPETLERIVKALE